MEYMVTDGQSLVKNGSVLLSALIKPDSASHWLSFDPNALALGGVVPSKEGLANSSSTAAFSSEARMEKTGDGRRKHHSLREGQAGKGQVYAALPTRTSTVSNPTTPSPSYAAGMTSTISAATQSQPLSAFADSTMVNVTFSARSLDSRTISTLKVTFLLGTNVACPTSSCPIPTAGSSADGADDNSRAARTGLILALVFGSLLLAAAGVACYCMWRRRRGSSSRAADTKETLAQFEGKEHDAGWGRNSFISSRTDLETGVNTKEEASGRTFVYSMAETRSMQTSIPRGESDGENSSRAVTPTVLGHSANESVANGPDVPSSNSETSGSRYEYGTSIGTNYGAKAHGRTESASGTDKEAVSSAESEFEGMFRSYFSWIEC